MIQSTNVQRSGSLMINEIFNAVCSNEFKTLMIMIRSFSDLALLNCFIELLSDTQSSQEVYNIF